MHSLLRLKELIFSSATRGTRAPRLNCVTERPSRSAQAYRGCGGTASHRWCCRGVTPRLLWPCAGAVAEPVPCPGSAERRICKGESRVFAPGVKQCSKRVRTLGEEAGPGAAVFPSQRHQRNPSSPLTSAAVPSASLPPEEFPQSICRVRVS